MRHLTRIRRSAVLSSPVRDITLVLVLVVSLTSFHGCSRCANEHAPATTAQWSGTFLAGDDPASLRDYLETVEEVKPKTFRVEWNAATVALDRSAAIRSLRGVSDHGAVITLASAEPAVAKLKVGSILWVWDVAIRKVEAIESNGDETIVHTTAVPLNEAIPNADIEFEAPITFRQLYVERRAAKPRTTARARAVRPLPSGYLLASYDSPRIARGGARTHLVGDARSREGNEAPLGKGPIDEPEDAENGAFAGQTYTGRMKGYQYSVGYETRPGGLTLVMQARNAEDGDEGGGEGDLGSEMAKKERERAKELEKELKEFRATLQAATKDLQDEQNGLRELDADYSLKLAKLKSETDGVDPHLVDASKSAQKYQREESARLKKEWDDKRTIENKKLAAIQRILDETRSAKKNAEARDRAKAAAKQIGKQLFDIVSDNLDIRFKARTEIEGVSGAGSLAFRDGGVQSARFEWKNLKGAAHIAFVGRLGDPGTRTSVIDPVMNVPIVFDVPMPIGGIPFVFQVGADFNIRVALSGQHATLQFAGDFEFRGDSGYAYASDEVAFKSTFSSDKKPTVATYEGFSPGASAVVLGVQLPRFGFGIGLLGASSVAYTDVVHVLTFTNAGAVGGITLAPPCKRITYDAIGHVGVQTEVSGNAGRALNYAGKLIGVGGEASHNSAAKEYSEKIGMFTDAVKAVTNPKREIFKIRKEILDPPLKGCEID